MGVSSYETGDPLTINSQFRLGSLTKQFTAMAVMLLSKDKRLDYDKPIIMTLYQKLKAEQPEKYDFSEPVLNYLGYELIRNHQLQDAIEIFILNTTIFPESANVYDSLGEAYMLDDQKEKAIENYMKSLTFNPQNTNARRMLQKLQQ